MWARTRQSQRRRLNGRRDSGASPNQSILKNYFGKIAATAAVQKKVRFHLTNGVATATLSENSPQPPTPTPTNLPVVQPEPGQKPRSESGTGPKPVKVPLASPLSQPKPGQRPMSQSVTRPKPVKVPLASPLSQPKPGQRPMSQSVMGPKPVKVPLASPLSQPKPGQRPMSQSVTGPKPVQVPPASPLSQPKPGQKPRSESVTGLKPMQVPLASRSSPPSQPKLGQKPKLESGTGLKPVQIPPASPLSQPKKPKLESVTGLKPVQVPPDSPPLRSQPRPGQKPAPPRSQTRAPVIPSTKQQRAPPAALPELPNPSKEGPLPIKPPAGEPKLNRSSREPVQKKPKLQQNLRRRRNQKSGKASKSSDEYYEVEAIRDHRKKEGCKEYEYLLKWKGYPDSDNSWVVGSDLRCWNILQEYILAHMDMVDGSGSKKLVLKVQSSSLSGGQSSSLSDDLSSSLSGGQSSSLSGGKSSSLSGGKSSSLSGGKSSSLSGGKSSFLSGGQSSSLSGGQSSSLSGGKSSSLSGGQSSSLSGGQSSSLSGGKSSSLSGGKSSSLSGGQSSSLSGGKSSSLCGGKSSSLIGGKSSSLSGGGTQVVKKQAEKPRERPLSSQEKKKKPPSIFPPSTDSITPTCSTLAPSRTCNGDTIRINGLSEKFPRVDFKYPVAGEPLLPPSLPPLHESLLDSLRDDLSQASSVSTDSIFLNESFRLNIDSSEGWSSGEEDDHGDTVVPQIIRLLPPPYHQLPQKLNGFKHLGQTVKLAGQQLTAGDEQAPLKIHRQPNGCVNGFHFAAICAAVKSCSEQKPTLNGSVELPWSQRQPRKRPRSVSPPTILTSSEPHPPKRNLLQAFLVVPPPLPLPLPLPLPPPPPPPPTTATQVPALHPSLSLATLGLPLLSSNLRLTTQKQRKPSESYQDQLLEWQYELNRQRHGKEAIIYVENLVDEAPPPKDFTYITSNRYGKGVPNPNDPENLVRLCGCVCYHLGKKCGPRAEHCCPTMAGSVFAYTAAGKIKSTAGTPIFECNSKCSCPSDCANRVVQHGRKIPLCIFRTDSRGWGVKTIEPIKANTFVAEYIGEVITSEEAEQRGRKYDEDGETYLFDLDFNDDPAFTIDAAKFGNIAHFFNHSCDPSLIVYSVWIETLDQRLPRIAFFTTRNVSAGEELTFDYQMNSREESSRKMGKIPCLCGSENCIGYLY